MPSQLKVAAELHLGGKSTRQTLDLVCLTPFAHFSPERLDAFFLSASRFGPLAGFALLLAYPAA